MKKLIALGALSLTVPAVAQTAPAPEQAVAPEPARLAAAKPVIDRLWPIGTYRRLMDGTMTKMVTGMMDSMFDMRAADIAPTDKAKDEAGDKSMGEIAQTRDPHFRERTRIMMDVMFKEMMPIFDRLEPTVREAMVKIYARKFTVAQLGELDRFLQTPTGALYAHEWMTAYMDPDMLKGMQAFTPELLKAMPAIMAKAEEATKHLPPAPKPETSQ